MRVRAMVLASALAVVSVSGVADAATQHATKHKHAKKTSKPVCHIITDPSGDAAFDPAGTQTQTGPQDANADILSADIASNASYVTAVIRLKSLATPDTTWPEAHFYMVSWTVPGHSSPVYLGATIDPNPASAGYGPQDVFGDGGFVGSQAVFGLNYYNISSAKVKATIDTAKGTITLSVPIAQLKGYGTYKPGTRFTSINASTQQLVNGPVLPSNVPGVGGSVAWGFADDAAVGGNYVAGTPSCVKPGS